MGDTLDDLPQPAHKETVDPESLETDGDNPNEMSDEQFGLLCDRMRQNGWLGGPIITDTDGLIADGQHRWQAAQEIGLTEVPVKQYEIDDATRRLWRQELNKIHGEHDTKRDALEYDYLLDNGKTDEVQALTNAADEDLDELLAEIKMDTSRPATYEYDTAHNVYFEDCVEGMRERLDDDSVDMVFTSPPYNVEKGDSFLQRDGEIAYSDDMEQSDYFDLLKDVFHELDRVVKPSGHIFVNHQNDFRDGSIEPPKFVRDLMPTTWRSYIVWDKGNVPQGALRTNGDSQFYMNWEPVYHFSEDPSPISEGERSGVWSVAPISGGERTDAGEHPAPFPMELVGRAIEATTSKGDTVLDPFMGSGTSAVAAILNDRNYVGFELDEQGAYKPIIERRIGEAKRQVAANEQ